MANNKVLYGDQVVMDITDTTAEAADVAAGEVFYDRGGNRTVGTGDYYTKLETDALLDDKVGFTDAATDTIYGVVKLNPNESVSVNANGQLTVGGRLGQFPNGGLYYPTTADPAQVKPYSLLMTDAVNLSVDQRDMVIAGGNNITCKSAAAGSTQYRVSNTYDNRLACAALKGGRLALNQTAAATKTVSIVSVKFANGNDVVPYSGATESNNDIIITVDETVNPSSATTTIRGYGTWDSSDILSIGQCNGANGGKVFEVGMNLRAEANQVMLFGNGCYSNANNSGALGRGNINKKQFAFLLGQGHDSSNGPEGVCAAGKWSIISSDTAFVVGGGTGDTARKNIFEVKTNGDVYINGTKVLP